MLYLILGSNIISFPAAGNFDSKLVLSPLINENKTRVFAWSCISGQEVFVGEIKSTADRSKTITNNKIITGHGQEINQFIIKKINNFECV